MIDMADPSFAATRRVEEVDGGFVVYVQPPPIIGKFPERSVRLTPEQFTRYQRWRSEDGLIQELLPDLSDSQREILMSGLDDEDFCVVANGGEDAD